MRFNSIIRTTSQIFFTLAFLALLFLGKLQMWMLLFALGILVSFVAGRWYCGWVCQMGSLLRVLSFIKRKLHIPQAKLPFFAKFAWFRYLSLFLTFAFMFIMQKNGLQHIAVISLTISAFLLTLFFHESFWHNSICPYGTLLSLTTRTSKIRVQIPEDTFIACGKCEKVCPTQTIVKMESKKRKVQAVNCLNCGQCMDECPVHIIQYSK